MKSLANLFVALFVVVSIVSCGPTKKNDDSAEKAKGANNDTFDKVEVEKDADFVVNTIAASYGEIKLVELALGKSGSVSVKNTVEMLKSDHLRF